ncbi:MAG: tRNA pseudouridine synthase A [Calditrichaeota bacterium]|nr:tRNA pseudouridine synthase A [Calditrichota bacterium]MCB9366429.1 tRNA pseudouridine synthase A [Calditrichota bacterium]
MQLQPDRRTVQQCVEEALLPLFVEPVRLIPSSRTDAGVHARRQVAHFDVSSRRNPFAIVRAGNSELPGDVRILAAEEKSVDFHARFSARWRAYTYRISLVPVALGRQYVWQFPQRIRTELLPELAAQVMGTHSFEAFAHESPLERHDYECSVYKSEWTIEENQLKYHIQASRFVHGLVRMLVGTMIDVACGRGSATSLTEVLLSRDNQNAGTKAPACGLTLESVGYMNWPGL